MNTCGTCWWFLADVVPVEGRDGVCRHPCLLDPQKEYAPRLRNTGQCIANTTTGTYWRTRGGLQVLDPRLLDEAREGKKKPLDSRSLANAGEVRAFQDDDRRHCPSGEGT